MRSVVNRNVVMRRITVFKSLITAATPSEMVCLCYVHGVSKACPRCVQGVSKVCPMCVHGVFKVCPWCVQY
jgi:hypothetical protein